MGKTLGELAAFLGGELRGPADLVIRGLASVDHPGRSRDRLP
jgi:hypothetical protein